MALSKIERSRYGGLFPLDGTSYFDPPQPLVEGLITKRQFTLLTGQPKVGKSTYGAHLAYSVATGEPFFGREVLEQGHVVYIALEREDQTQERINKLIELNGGKGKGMVHLLVPGEHEVLGHLFFNHSSQRDDVQIVIDMIEKSGVKDVKLFVIDSLENSIDGSDSSQSDAGPWCAGLKRLLDHFESTALVLHHDNKSAEGDTRSSTAYRGSGVFLARSGGWIRATNSGDKRVRLKTERGNYGNTWEETVTINDFGLYEVFMPETQTKLTQKGFIEQVLIELRDQGKTQVRQTEVVEYAQDHCLNAWPSLGQPQVSRAIDALGDKVVAHESEVDGRGVTYEYVAS